MELQLMIQKPEYKGFREKYLSNNRCQHQGFYGLKVTKKILI